MWRHRRRAVRTVVAVVGALAWAVAGEAVAAPLDVRVVVQASSDADVTVARTVLEALASRLPAGAIAGVWVDAATLESRAPRRAVDDDWRRLVRVVAGALKPNAAPEDLRNALEQVAWDADVGQSRRDLVLIASSASVASAASADAARRARIEALLPRLTRAGFRVHVVLPTGTDAPLLRQIAAATGGIAGAVEKLEGANALIDRFIAEDRGAGGADGSFVIEGAPNEVTIVASQHARHLKLISPAEQTLDASVVSAFVRWFEQEERTVVTLSGPASGRWRFEPAPDRVVVLDDLQLRVRPDVVDGRVAGLVAVLTNDDRTIDDRLLDGLVIVQAGRESEGADASLRVHLPTDASQRYAIDLGAELLPDDRVRVQALGRTFEREVEFSLSSSAPIRVTATAGSAGDAVIDVRVLASGIVGNSLHVLGSLEFPDGRATVAAGIRQPDGAWQMRAPPLGKQVEATFRIDGNYLNNKEFTISTEPVDIRLPLDRTLTAEFDLDGRTIGTAVKRAPVHATPATNEVPEREGSAPEATREPAPSPRAGNTAKPATRPKLTRIDAIGAGALVGINLLALLVAVARALLPRRAAAEAAPPRESALDAALTQYREALAGAASRLGQSAR